MDRIFRYAFSKWVDFTSLTACSSDKENITDTYLTFELTKNSKKTHQILTFENILFSTRQKT
ncbi:hypothetical protein CHX27_13775 [Flavobacterium aurantiibacter]|uniref:Uncharacterized protein n=1 Tax=Flavobacterium aurantiibacter TaxID=2023067 RepID=A0A255ZI58_9FLAO|nr:hypothetical protein CHX27_13775 [Flavobacterium aurantiibacter]